MKERPILFSAPMVRALLSGTKTQTRRIIKPQPYIDTMGNFCWDGGNYGQDMNGRPLSDSLASPLPWCDTGKVRCPYDAPGDRLWVKETFRFTSEFDDASPSRVADLCLDAGYRKPWAPLQYEANLERHDWKWTGTPPGHDPKPGKTRVSIHMPRWASRITLEITRVRVERLHDCSEVDAEAEGVDFLRHAPDADETLSAKQLYACLWDSINGASAWDRNPWVWVMEFRRL